MTKIEEAKRIIEVSDRVTEFVRSSFKPGDNGSELKAFYLTEELRETCYEHGPEVANAYVESAEENDLLKRALIEAQSACTSLTVEQEDRVARLIEQYEYEIGTKQ